MPASKKKQPNGSVTGPARGGFALGRGNMVTRKASLRPLPQRIGRLRRRSNLCDKLRTPLFRLAYERLIRRPRARGGPHPRVTKAGAKKCRPHKNDAIASNTIDVRRRNFRCAHRTQAVSNDQLLRGFASSRALRFAATHVGKSVEHAMMRGEAAEKFPTRSRSGCGGAGSTDFQNRDRPGGQRRQVRSTRIKVAARPRLLLDRNSGRAFG